MRGQLGDEAQWRTAITTRRAAFRHVIHRSPGRAINCRPTRSLSRWSVTIGDALDAELRALCADFDAGLDAALSELHAVPDVARRRALHTP